MTNYTVRVELHDADDGDYEDLHKEMRAQGFSKNLNINGVQWKLPSAEYSIVSELTSGQVLIKAQTAANKVQSVPQPSILVTGSSTPRVFSGLKQVK
ncbi:type V toxin-antitoxin system endoribonuclease antitoxin GhoS [Cronobacter sakazakii]|nr:type V toxin-antitoxin system endoribonuclease antitoxin GhoS [Cronobacter sakazakii]